MGSEPDGQDSIAVQIAPSDHWPEMEALICIVSDLKKGTSSTSGMQQTVNTSSLLQHRIAVVVPTRMKQISSAIFAKDFGQFAELTMRDSNQFHAVCVDTFPPIFYMNDISKAIIAAVNEINRAKGKLIAAYTYDAGPNAVIYALQEDMASVKAVIGELFVQSGEGVLPPGFERKHVPSGFRDSVSRLIHTRVGDGPRVLSKGESLIGEAGFPKQQ